MAKSEKTKLENGRIYEIGYLLSPMIPVEVLAERVTQNLKTAIDLLGGQVVSEVSPCHITLAYPIKKNIEHRQLTFREAFFGSLRFEAVPKVAAELTNKLASAPDLIRYLLIEVPKATLRDEERIKERASRPPSSPDTNKTKGESQLPLSVAEMDKQIDQLLTTEAYVSK